MRLDSRNLAARAMLFFMIVTNWIRVKWSSQTVPVPGLGESTFGEESRRANTYRDSDGVARRAKRHT